MKAHGKRIALLALMFPVFLVSCGDDDATGPEAGYPAATTIDLLLDNFLKAYTSMSLVEYERLLDEEFGFTFDMSDVGESSDYRLAWSSQEELLSAASMFGGVPDRKNRVAQSVRMGFVAGDPEDSNLGGGAKKIVLSTFELEIESIEVGSGETWFLRTKGGYFVDLHVREADGSPPVWKILRIIDRPPTTAIPETDDLPYSESTTWGAIRGTHLNVPPDGSGFPPARTIHQLLENLRAAHNERNYEEYEALLDPSYEFVFEPADDPWNPDRWSREQDLASTASLFGREPDVRGRVADRITFAFDGVEATDPDDLVLGHILLTLKDLEIEVATTNPDNGETLILHTVGDYKAHCTVRRIETDPVRWGFLEIVDDPPNTIVRGPAVEWTAWGAIKALWR
jgi:hypothetical protein